MKMLKALRIAGVALAVMAVPAAGAQAADMDRPVAARQAVMKLNGFYMGQLGGMAKGEMAYDAKVAEGAANGLLALAKLDTSSMWIKGSGNDVLGTKTRAKPEIWSTYPDVANKSKALKAALEDLVKVAGTGLEGLKGGIGAVGKACGGCHKPFRAEKK
ncbi:MAG: cytochrome c [Proteobacteria bacterium]|nr:cytochrome c [Pseudomonadota bacterium]